jgi:hypothetical protein
LTIPADTLAWYSPNTWADESPLKSPIPLNEIPFKELSESSQIWINNPPRYPSRDVAIVSGRSIVFSSDDDIQNKIGVFIERYRNAYNNLLFYVDDIMNHKNSHNGADFIINLPRDVLYALDKIDEIRQIRTLIQKSKIVNVGVIVFIKEHLELFFDFFAKPDSFINNEIARMLKKIDVHILKLSDKFFWMNHAVRNGEMTQEEYDKRRKEYVEIYSDRVNNYTQTFLNFVDTLKKCLDIVTGEYQAFLDYTNF